MRVFRRRLASGALAVSLLQLALLFAAPISACCHPAAGSHAALQTAADDDAPDCCPPGSHPAGECPRHSRSHHDSASSTKQTHCRFTCDMPHGPQFVLGAIGVLPSPSQTPVRVTSSALSSLQGPDLIVRPAVPDAPPPRLL